MTGEVVPVDPVDPPTMSSALAVAVASPQFAFSLSETQLPALEEIPEYSPTAREQASAEALLADQAARVELPLWMARRSPGGRFILTPIHLDSYLGRALTMRALGITSQSLLDTILNSLVRLSLGSSGVDELRFNELLAIVRALEPRDETEALLATQMAAIHDACLSLTAQLGRSEWITRQDSAANALTKLMRTYALQMETLKRHRNKGQQVTVKHVTINDGGQAIVGM